MSLADFILRKSLESPPSKQGYVIVAKSDSAKAIIPTLPRDITSVYDVYVEEGNLCLKVRLKEYWEAKLKGRPINWNGVKETIKRTWFSNFEYGKDYEVLIL